jgi:hypothetical protein
MVEDRGTLLAMLTGVNVARRRVQHPEIHEREDRGSSYWYFRYWEDKPQPDGTIKSSRKFYKCGPSRGKDKISKTRAEIILDDFLAKLVTNQEPAPVESAPPPSQAAPAPAPPEPAISTSTPRGSSTVFPA